MMIRTLRLRSHAAAAVALLISLTAFAAVAQENGGVRVDALGVVFYAKLSDAREDLVSKRMMPPRYQGLLIRSVDSQSPAHQAGLKALDLLVAIDGKRLTSARQLNGVKLGLGDRDRIVLRRFDGSKWRLGGEEAPVAGNPPKKKQITRSWIAKTSEKSVNSKMFPRLSAEYVKAENATRVKYATEVNSISLMGSFLAMPDLATPDQYSFKFELRQLISDGDLPLFPKDAFLVVDDVEYHFPRTGGGKSTAKGEEGYYEGSRFQMLHEDHFTALESLKQESKATIRLIGRSSEMKLVLSDDQVAGIKQLFDAYKSLDGPVVIRAKGSRGTRGRVDPQ
jgi:hypothetical protein